MVSLLRLSDHPVLLALLLLLCNSSDASTKWTVGSSDGANFSFASCAVYQVHRRLLLVYVGSSDGVFSFSFLSRFLPLKNNYLLNLTCGIFASMRPRNVYKDMLNNMVNLIDHVVMNHQNQTRTNGMRSHAR
jgi:hypothetical protein